MDYVYVPWYSPQFCKGVWYHNYCPVPVLIEPESTHPVEINRAKTPLQALDTKHLPKITQAELKDLNKTSQNIVLKNKGKYFVILAMCEDDIHKSIKYGIWTSTFEGNNILNEVFAKCQGNEPVYLFFSVVNSGMFVGVAEMISAVNFKVSFNGWYPDYSNLGFFSVRWVFVKDIWLNKVKYIRIAQGVSIAEAGDCQEIPRNAATKLVKAFIDAKNFKSLLQDLEYYDRKEELVLSSLAY
jgi:hypothetical protein